MISFLFYFFLQRRESVSDGQAEADCHQWQVSAGHLTQEAEDFRPAVIAFRGITYHVTHVTHWTSPPTWHLSSPHVHLSQYLSYQRDPRHVSLHRCVLHQPQPQHCFTDMWRSKNTRRFHCCFVFLSKCWSFKSPQIEDLHLKKRVHLEKKNTVYSVSCCCLNSHHVF